MGGESPRGEVLAAQALSSAAHEPLGVGARYAQKSGSVTVLQHASSPGRGAS